MKSDDWFRDDIYPPPERESPVERAVRERLARTGRALHVLLVATVALIAILMLFWLVKVFVCDFREALFPDMARRALWLCPMSYTAFPGKGAVPPDS